MSSSFKKQSPPTGIVKTFNSSPFSETNWNYTTTNNKKCLTPSIKNVDICLKQDLYVERDLYVGGTMAAVSDFKLKENIEDLNLSLCDKLLKVIPKQYNYKKDSNKHIHYGIIAQDLEEELPNLVKIVNIETDGKVEETKVVNYMEMIPFLMLKITDLQKQIDELKENMLS
jgi:SepF-like predicted cell division protein (DUF552 family)